MIKKAVEEVAKEQGYFDVIDFLYDYRMIPGISRALPKHTKIDFIKLMLKRKNHK